MALTATKGKSESCDATLILDGKEFNGATGKGTGHAEMTALNEIINEVSMDLGKSPSKSIAEAAAYIKGAKSRAVFCPSRPVCLKCGTVLKALKFTVDGTHTTWGTATAGSTEWGVSMNVQALLGALGVDYGAVKALG